VVVEDRVDLGQLDEVEDVDRPRARGSSASSSSGSMIT
jgi:hypothetical protein